MSMRKRYEMTCDSPACDTELITSAVEFDAALEALTDASWSYLANRFGLWIRCPVHGYELSQRPLDVPLTCP